jgi:plasmid stability protein
MSVMIQIRNVPPELPRSAKVRAAQEGRTLSDLALRALRRELERPTLEEILARLDDLPAVQLERPAADWIREDRDSR